MPLLLCPNDQSSMQTVSRSGVEFDMCPTCRGIWLDRGELEKLMGAARQEGAPAPQAPQAPPSQPGYGHAPAHGYAPHYGERGEWGERGERGEWGERGEHGHYGHRRRSSIFDIFD